jgi:hypothetical protein
LPAEAKFAGFDARENQASFVSHLTVIGFVKKEPGDAETIFSFASLSSTFGEMIGLIFSSVIT